MSRLLSTTVMGALISTLALMSVGTLEAKPEKIVLDVLGMRESADAVRIQDTLKKQAGVMAATCDRGAAICDVDIDPAKIKKEDLVGSVNKLGFRASLRGEALKSGQDQKEPQASPAGKPGASPTGSVPSGHDPSQAKP